MNLSRKEIIKAAVNKFLCWKLPKDFSPDSFISFDGKKHDTWGGYPNSWPTGTNLFDAKQARAMFEHCLNEVLQSRLAEGEQEPELNWYHSKGGILTDRAAWLIETQVGGPTHWIASYKLEGPCPLTNDANTAIHFPTKESAEQMLDALFNLPRKGTVLGYGRNEYEVTEHLFMGAAPQATKGEQEPAYTKVEEEILTRYWVESTGRGFWPAVVKCGTGAVGIFVGTKKQAERVRQALQTACLDGAFMASNAAPQGAPK